MPKRKSIVNGTLGPAENQTEDPKRNDYEQQRLESLIARGDIKLTDSAADARAADDSFLKYSNHVVGYHLGLIRKKKGTKTTEFSGDCLLS